MTDQKRNQIESILGKAKWFLLIGGLIILLLPLIITQKAFHGMLDFTETGQIGDTIGGITAPFMNLIGAILVFYALKAQVTGNLLIQEQIDKDNEEKECQNEGQNLNQLFSYLTENINSFRFKTLPTHLLRNIDDEEANYEFIGGEAFYELFCQVRCHYHGTQDELHSHQSVSELLSILKVMDLLLNKLYNNKSKNREILYTLVRHLFEYKVITRIRYEDEEELMVEYCSACDCNHGLPDELRNLIIQIRTKLQ